MFRLFNFIFRRHAAAPRGGAGREEEAAVDELTPMHMPAGTDTPDQESTMLTIHDLPDGVIELIGLTLKGEGSGQVVGDYLNFASTSKSFRGTLSANINLLTIHLLAEPFIKGSHSPLELKQQVQKIATRFGLANHFVIHADASASLRFKPVGLPSLESMSHRIRLNRTSTSPLLNTSAALEALADAWKPPAGASQHNQAPESAATSSVTARPLSESFLLILDIDFTPELAPINIEEEQQELEAGEGKDALSRSWERDAEIFMRGLDRSLPLLMGKVGSLSLKSCTSLLLPSLGISALASSTLSELKICLPKAQIVPSSQLSFLTSLSNLKSLSLETYLGPTTQPHHPTHLLSYALSHLTSLTRLELTQSSNSRNYLCSCPLVPTLTNLESLHLRFIELASYTELCSLTRLSELFVTVGDENAETLDGIVATASSTHSAWSDPLARSLEDLNPLDLWSALGRLPSLTRLSINTFKSSTGGSAVYDEEDDEEEYDEDGMPLPSRFGIVRLPSALPSSLHRLVTLGLLISHPQDLSALAPLTALTQLVLSIESYGSRRSHHSDYEEEEEEEDSDEGKDDDDADSDEEEWEEDKDGEKDEEEKSELKDETMDETDSDSIAFFSLLSPLTKLRSFHLFDSVCGLPVTNNGLKILMAGKDSLEDLYLDGHVEVSDWSIVKGKSLKKLAVHHSHFSSRFIDLSVLPQSLEHLSLESVKVSSFPKLEKLEHLNLFWPLSFLSSLALYDSVNRLTNLHTLTLEIDLDAYMASREGDDVCPHCSRRMKSESEDDDEEADSEDISHSECDSAEPPSLTEASSDSASQPLNESSWLSLPFSELKHAMSLRNLTLCFIEGGEDTHDALDQDFVAQVSQLTRLERLEIWNGYGTDWEQGVDLRPFTELRGLRQLSMEAVPREPAQALYLVLKHSKALPFCKVRIVVDNEPPIEEDEEDEDDEYFTEGDEEEDEDEEAEEDSDEEEEDSESLPDLIPA